MVFICESSLCITHLSYKLFLSIISRLPWGTNRHTTLLLFSPQSVCVLVCPRASVDAGPNLDSDEFTRRHSSNKIQGWFYVPLADNRLVVMGMHYELITDLLSRGCDRGDSKLRKCVCVCVWMCIWGFKTNTWGFPPQSKFPHLFYLIGTFAFSQLCTCFWSCYLNWSQTSTGDPLFLIPHWLTWTQAHNPIHASPHTCLDNI